MAERIDGWTLLARIVAHPYRFASCDATVALAAHLLLRDQLARGVASRDALVGLADVVGQAPLIEAIKGLASHEALEVLDKIEGPDALGEQRTPRAARRRLVAMLKREAAPPQAPSAAGAPPLTDAERPLLRRRAMGARRLRPAG